MTVAPFDRSLQDFLRGPKDMNAVDVDMVFSIHFDEFMDDNEREIEPSGPLDDLPFLKHSSVVPEVYYRTCDNGVIAFSPDKEPIGCYLWSALVLDEKWQRLGLGRELVILRLTIDGTNPVWDLDSPTYSPAGFAAHVSAWRQMNNY